MKTLDNRLAVRGSSPPHRCRGVARGTARWQPRWVTRYQANWAELLVSHKDAVETRGKLSRAASTKS
jgi:hypothetical protein